MNLSLKDAAELVGVSKVALLKAIQKGHLKADRGDNKEWLVSAAEATRYRDSRQHKTLTSRKLVSDKLTTDNSKLSVIDQVKDQVIEQLNQRLRETVEGYTAQLAAKEETIQTLRLLTDQSAEKAKQLPQEAVEKIARLEVELRMAKEQAAAITPEEIAELKRKAKAADEQQALNVMRDKLVAEHNALSLFKRMTTPKPTMQDVRAALKSIRAGEGVLVQPGNIHDNQQEKQQ